MYHSTSARQRTRLPPLENLRNIKKKKTRASDILKRVSDLANLDIKTHRSDVISTENSNNINTSIDIDTQNQQKKSKILAINTTNETDKPVVSIIYFLCLIIHVTIYY